MKLHIGVGCSIDLVTFCLPPGAKRRLGSGRIGGARLATPETDLGSADSSVVVVIVGRKLRGCVPGDVQICTVPSWLPVANMKGSATGFQAMQVMSPPKADARMWCKYDADSRSHI